MIVALPILAVDLLLTYYAAQTVGWGLALGLWLIRLAGGIGWNVAQEASR